MRISFLKVQNFRSIKSLAVKVPRVCALVGPNNSGKSNILKAIAAVLEKDWVTVTSFNEEDVYRRDPSKDISISVRLDPPGRIERYGVGVDIECMGYCFTRYVQAPRTGQRRLVHEMIDTKGKDNIMLPKKRFKKGEKTEWEVISDIPGELRAQIPLIYIGTNRTLRGQMPGARNSLLGQLLAGVDEELQSGAEKLAIRDHEGNLVEDTRRNHFRSLLARAMEVLRTDGFTTIESSIKKHILEHLGLDAIADADKLDFSFQPFETKEFFRNMELRIREEGGFQINATELGEGLQNAMVLAILRAFESTQKKGAILLIEEPEMFLHPQMQRSLYKTLRKIGENNQVIYTTHSPHFVSIPEFDEVLLVRKGANGTEVTASDIKMTPILREKFRKELDPERNELFFAKRVLFVEGDTEKLALPVYAEKRGFDLDRAGTTIVEVGGKKSLKAMAEVAISFGIPTGILFDRDSKDFKSERDKEEACNGELLGLAPEGSMHAAWMMEKDYEAVVRATVGEEVYSELCGTYSTPSKPIKGRLIATDPRTPIPRIIEKVLEWAIAKG